MIQGPAVAGWFAFLCGIRCFPLIFQGSSSQGLFSGGGSTAHWGLRFSGDLAGLITGEYLASCRTGPVAGGAPASRREDPVAGGAPASRREAPSSGARRGPDTEGWWTAESRCSRRAWLRHSPASLNGPFGPPRQVFQLLLAGAPSCWMPLGAKVLPLPSNRPLFL